MQLKPWPSGPEAAPNADQIAVAMVAAAIETDDSERLAKAVGPDGGGARGPDHAGALAGARSAQHAVAEVRRG